MNKEERDVLVAYRLQCAHESLIEASVLAGQELRRGATNRSYYAMYYAVIALLATGDIHPRTHKGTRQQFGLHFVVPGIIPEHLGDAFSELFERRHSGDYDDFVNIDAETVARLHDLAAELVDLIGRIIKNAVP